LSVHCSNIPSANLSGFDLFLFIIADSAGPKILLYSFIPAKHGSPDMMSVAPLTSFAVSLFSQSCLDFYTRGLPLTWKPSSGFLWVVSGLLKASLPRGNRIHYVLLSCGCKLCQNRATCMCRQCLSLSLSPHFHKLQHIFLRRGFMFNYCMQFLHGTKIIAQLC